MDGAYIALRGYKFQFDRTIIEIFRNPKSKIGVEQLQDYGFDDYLVQVKYHNTDYNAAQQKQKIKKPLLLLFDQFLANRKKRFILYIYLKNVSPASKKLTLKELDDIFGRTNKFSSADKQDFIKKFTLIHAGDFEQQYTDVLKLIKDNYSKTNEEAELYYSIISSYLLEIVIKNPPSKITNRVTSKSDIDTLIESGKKIIFHSTFLDTLNKEQQLKYLNKTYFKKGLNTEPFERLFVVDIDEDVSNSTAKELILKIKEKWSKNKTKIIPDADRFVPYIFYKGILPENLAKLKTDLQKDGYVISDGYDFLNADFNLNSIKERPTYQNRLFFKFLNTQNELELLLNNLDRTAEIFEFFREVPSEISFDGKHMKIQVTDFDDIKHII